MGTDPRPQSPVSASQRRQRRVRRDSSCDRAVRRSAARGRRCRCSAPTARRWRGRRRPPRSVLPVLPLDDPPIAGRPNTCDERLGDEADALAVARRRASLSRTSRALCDFGKSLRDSVSSTSGSVELALEECDLLVKRPRADDAAEQMRRRIGDKARLVDLRGQDVAASAAADQNLAACRRSCARASSVSAPADAAKIAAIVPAAPAPTTTTRGMRRRTGGTSG